MSDKKIDLSKIVKAMNMISLALFVITLIGYIRSAATGESAFGSLYIPVTAICAVLSAISLIFLFRRKKAVSFVMYIFVTLISIIPTVIWRLAYCFETMMQLPFPHIITRFFVISLSVLTTVFLGVYNEKPKGYERRRKKRSEGEND